ncbi:MAG: epoxyqueuosine reductase [Clostridiales bacterium]|nr:epoxyqueuosine reductase [Clostridiales bacterium]
MEEEHFIFSVKEQSIKQILVSLGADVCGIGSIDRFKDAPAGFSPKDIYHECRSVISFGVALPKGVMEVSPKLIYSHFNGPVITQRVDEIALLASKRIEEQWNAVAVPIPSDAPNEYWDAENLTARGMISMKHTAVSCGIGQLGKSTLLLNPTYGSLLVIGAILTNLELQSDELCENICIDKCRRCIDHCPAHAINEGNVSQKLCRPNTYGKTARGFDTVECNACRNVCPMKYGKVKKTLESNVTS